MCGWQVKLCDPLVTHGPYLSTLAVMLPIIRRYTNHQITYLLTHCADSYCLSVVSVSVMYIVLVLNMYTVPQKLDFTFLNNLVKCSHDVIHVVSLCCRQCQACVKIVSNKLASSFDDRTASMLSLIIASVKPYFPDTPPPVH